MTRDPGLEGTRRTDATVLLPPEQLAGDGAEILGDSYRHLFRARRLAVGDRLRVVDGEGRAREGLIERVEKDRARVELGAELDAWEAARRLVLIVAPPRPERASWLVEKATELGTARIAWVRTERTGRLPTQAQLERHHRVAVAAVEQCGRARLPAISGPHPWEEVPRLVAGLDRWWTLDLAGERRATPEAAQDAVGLVIGPEGGWTQGERRELAAWGGEAWALGDRVLRVETAAVSGAALLLASS